MKDDIVTCEEARYALYNAVSFDSHPVHGETLERFIDQAEELEGTLRLTMRANSNVLAENARLRAACEAAVNFIEDDTEPEWPTTPAQVAVLAQLREALEAK